ncbi:MAG: hypothetical protein VXZ82_06335 [Planctomycetota bacterium]|nr:hypothetical protein [Planctomycetota bacterium]
MSKDTPVNPIPADKSDEEHDSASASKQPLRGKPVQIGMRGLLLLVLVLGCGGGLYGKLFLSYPEIAIAILGIGSIAVPYLVAIFLIVALAGRSDSPSRIRVFAVLLAFCPVVGLVSTALLGYTQVQRTGPMGLAAQTNKQLIDGSLKNQIDEPWVWQELEKRLANQELSEEEVTTALGMLHDHMVTTKPDGYDSLLHWSGQFVSAVSNSELSALKELEDIYLAFFPKPDFSLDRQRESASNLQLNIRFGSTWADNQDFPFELICDLKEVRMDGEVRLTHNNYRFDDSRSDNIGGPFSVGKHLLEVKIDYALVDSDELVGISARSLSRGNWPKPIRTWTEVVKKEFQIYADDDPVVKLRTTGTMPVILVKRLVAQQENGRQKMKLVLEDFNASIPFSYEVFAKAEGFEKRLGSMIRYTTANSSIGSGGFQTTLRKKLPPEITTVDLLFKPYPRGLDSVPEAKEMWGIEFTISDVPVDRFE